MTPTNPSAGLSTGYQRWIQGLYLVMVALMLTACATQTGTLNEVAPAWQYKGKHDFEAERPGLGTSYRYESEIGWVDLYRYGLGRHNWANGVSDADFQRQFLMAINDVKSMARMGKYTQLQMTDSLDELIDGDTYRHVMMRYQNQGKAIESHLYMTARNGLLLKFRMSYFRPAPVSLDKIMQSFIKQYKNQPIGTVI